MNRFEKIDRIKKIRQRCVIMSKLMMVRRHLSKLSNELEECGTQSIIYFDMSKVDSLLKILSNLNYCESDHEEHGLSSKDEIQKLMIDINDVGKRYGLK